MSLTRQEWEMMWLDVKSIERNAKELDKTNKLRSVNILQGVESIKTKIQKVIGQME